MLEDAERLALGAERAQAAQPPAPDHHHLARLDVALVGRADQVERAGLAREHPAAVEPAERERAEAARVARRDQRVGGHHHEAPRAFQARERVDQALLGQLLARAREQLHDHLAVGGRAEDRTAALELAPDR